jgi:hypothetical protein
MSLGVRHSSSSRKRTREAVLSCGIVVSAGWERKKERWLVVMKAEVRGDDAVKG